MSLNAFVSCLCVCCTIGRTARAGASGVALSLVSPSELGLVATIQKAQEEKAKTEGAHAASDASDDAAAAAADASSTVSSRIHHHVGRYETVPCRASL